MAVIIRWFLRYAKLPAVTAHVWIYGQGILVNVLHGLYPRSVTAKLSCRSVRNAMAWRRMARTGPSAGN